MESFDDPTKALSNGSTEPRESSSRTSSARSQETPPPKTDDLNAAQSLTDDSINSDAVTKDSSSNSKENAVTDKQAATVKEEDDNANVNGDEDDDLESLDDGASTPPAFPQLSNARRESISQSMLDDGEGGDEEPNVARSFDRTSSPLPGERAPGEPRGEGKDAGRRKISEDGGIGRMYKFSLYETATRYYLVGMDFLEKRFRILKIDRTTGEDVGVETNDLVLSEDDTVYTRKEMNQLLDAVDDGNKSSGGLKLRCSTWGLLGFIRFTGAYYMLLITKRSQVAMIGGHYIYQIDGTELVSLTPPGTAAKARAEKNAEETKFVNIMNNVDLTRSFYFSYSYDITRTLQCNIAAEREALNREQEQQTQEGKPPASRGKRALHEHNSMFVWNHYLLKPVAASLKNAHDWCLPIIHGHVDQSALSIYGRVVYVTIIARRSRFFAGARFLKRGANDLGYVANDVETEQLVSEMLTTSFHAPGPKPYTDPQYTSYVQHRGSIPLHWSQDNTGVSPKPNIDLNLIDPFYSAAALHFNNLFERYGAPVYVLNLIKARERQPRESKLLQEYTNAVTYLNQFLPEDKKILYKAWDMSRASKSRDQDVIGTLEDIAEDIIPRTGFFQNGDSADGGLRMQNGIVRTNCIDCLDRTNAAQFVIGKRALGHQLRALRIIDTTSIEYDTDAINMFTDMWHDHGDTIAVQYGGSHLVNTMATYRKQNQWAGHSRDMVESFKRYYNNSFLDAQRQEAYNLFLGNYVFSQAQPMLWDLTTDYYLHHSDPRTWSELNRHNYIEWYTPEFLKEREMPPAPLSTKREVIERPIKTLDDYWLEYYRPLALSSFSKVFSFKMKSTVRYLPIRSTQAGRYDLSPFVVRSTHMHHGNRERRVPAQKGVTIREPSDDATDDTRSIASRGETAPSGIPQLMELSPPQPNQQSSSTSQPHQGIMKPPSAHPIRPRSPETPSTPASKAQLNQWGIGQLVSDSLNPNVSSSEAEEYQRYINHPLKVPLVITSEEDDSNAAAQLAQRPGTASSSLLRPPTATSSATGEAMVAKPTPKTKASSHTVAASGSSDLLEYTNKCKLEYGDLGGLVEDNMADYTEFLNVGEEGLTVVGDDYEKKRYKRYRQWLRGKSLFKQGVEV